MSGVSESELRDEVCRVGRSLFERGYVHATAGNISVRLPDGHLITPTDACLGFLEPRRLAKAQRSYYASLERAVQLAEGTGVTLLIEPLNGRDRPGYFLSNVDQAADVIDRTKLGSLRIMFDCYHVQVQQGDVITRLNRHFAKIGHIQIAGAPSRGEPDRGELNYIEILREINRLGWNGHIGAEYKPSGPTIESLGWLDDLRGLGLAV